ncbi:helix-turn-helix transcriptional regulator [Nocardia sp. CA-128927]|uniref:helix-turn-helix transcriptional regulator n=1 Tax=Nocardia sp. CA-128927 TaxID=3239975 RepID=UPI003D964906
MGVTGPLGRLYTVREFAELTGISKSTLDKWRSAGIGPAYLKQGGIVRYPASAYAEWVKNNTIGGVA